MREPQTTSFLCHCCFYVIVQLPLSVSIIPQLIISRCFAYTQKANTFFLLLVGFKCSNFSLRSVMAVFMLLSFPLFLSSAPRMTNKLQAHSNWFAVWVICLLQAGVCLCSLVLLESILPGLVTLPVKRLRLGVGASLPSADCLKGWELMGTGNRLFLSPSLTCKRPSLLSQSVNT